tara:strand:- start:302 stop:442 length:141 start_codon:yes stop_codon:yes gene_type:complete
VIIQDVIVSQRVSETEGNYAMFVEWQNNGMKEDGGGDVPNQVVLNP